MLPGMLKQVLMVAFIGVVTAGAVAWFDGHLADAVVKTGGSVESAVQGAPAVTPQYAAVPQRALGGRAVEIAKSPDGHFRTNVKLNHAMTPVMIDTGASLLALRESDARKAGIYPRSDDYVYQVSTANGTVKAARAEIRQMEIGTVTIRNVEAFVLPDAALSTNLLGMNVLSEFGEVSFSGNRLILDTLPG